MLWIILILLPIILTILVISYNKLITVKHRVLSGWSDINVQLKRRHDLIPKLVDAIKQYAGYEQATLPAVIELSRQVSNQLDIKVVAPFLKFKPTDYFEMQLS